MGAVVGLYVVVCVRVSGGVGAEIGVRVCLCVGVGNSAKVQRRRKGICMFRRRKAWCRRESLDWRNCWSGSLGVGVALRLSIWGKRMECCSWDGRI